MTRILILNDIHSGDTRPSTTRPGEVRQANTQALSTLESYIPKFNSDSYDFVVNLGDIIRDVKDRDLDQRLLKSALQIYVKIHGDKIFIPGNHEYKSLSSQDILASMAEVNIGNKFRGNIQLGRHTIVWIDSVIGNRDLASISDDTLRWLDATILPGNQVILFSHYSIPPLNGRGNFYFADDARYMSYTNGNKVLEILGKCAHAITINAHTHMATYKSNSNTECISCPAFSENITAMQHPDANPGIYSELEFDDSRALFRSYSGKYCFLSFELHT